MNWIANLTHLGVPPTLTGDIRWRIVFSNVVFICLPVVYLIFMGLDYKSYMRPFYELNFDQTVVPIIIAVCFLGLWLNKVGFTTISRIIFIISWPVLLHILPIKLLHTPGDYYLVFPLGIIFHALLTQLMFSYRDEKLFFFLFMGANFLLMLASPSILIYYDTSPHTSYAISAGIFYLYDIILYWLLFGLLTFYILVVMEKNITEMTNSKSLIEQQKEELNTFNQQLEKLVHERTRALEEQNEKLKSYAYYNAHLLRGPFCRIQGLVQLENIMPTSESEKEEIRKKLNDSITELDKRIKEIQLIVETIDPKDVD